MSTGDREYVFVERLVQMPDGTYEMKEVPQASDGSVRGLKGRRSYRCVLCGLVFKEGNVRMFRNKPYGVPCGCHKDIAGIIAIEKDGREGSSGTEETSDFSGLQR